LHVRLIATLPLEAQSMDRRTLTRISHERISLALEGASLNRIVTNPATEIAESDELLQPSIASS
jgi:hypothetical protein